MMLQNLRDNLKGAVAGVVIVIFVVPLVLFGVEQLFVGSAGGNEVATVNGESISRQELQRELVLEKNRLQQQRDLDPGSPELDDSKLTPSVIQRLVQRQALLQSAYEGGMGAAEGALWDEIRNIDAFKVDGVFDRELFKERISYLYTPATFIEASGKDFVLNQLNQGIAGTTFVTDSELALVAGITQQKRSFFSVEIPKEELSTIEVTDEELRSFYEENSNQYLEPESVVVEYVELSLSNLAETVEVAESEVKAIYDAEVAEFVADPKLVVAHILIEGDRSEATEKVNQVASRLEKGEAFAEIAKELSDDLGSKSQGGELGVLIAEAYPDAFVEAAKSLSVGEVSSAVETSSGTHFIKLLDVQNSAPPTFEDRKNAIHSQLARQMAMEIFAQKSNELDQKTFGRDSLVPAAEALGVEVQTSEKFSRRGGTGIAASKEVVDAAFADDVLKQSHNSRVLNLDGDRAVVIRLKKHQPELLKPFEVVKEQVKQRVLVSKQNQRLQEKADALVKKLNAAESYQSVAEEDGYKFAEYDAVTRTSFDGNPAVLQKAFSLARPEAGKPVIDRVNLPGSGLAVVGLLALEKGDASSMEDIQKEATKRQIGFQMNRSEMSAFEKAVIASADIEKPE